MSESKKARVRIVSKPEAPMPNAMVINSEDLPPDDLDLAMRPSTPVIKTERGWQVLRSFLRTPN